ncbi:nitric oxide reductase transcriptional regulator NorR [Dasania sp. GY-MA-18]|uniref:Nitric oxide reductase transcriptional regulator NorR n=1 Tax=Dasania phycosphaerae TaxID=2950436 RepID=A0A9J6RMB2_9GAMM|nr:MULTISPECIES: nitric oxide reductase transcriptional regulator NorR [Dasania]MCR8923429.1 nitric oxide reductase transcriptional regulator NorR [Dasania sp. GY-MA-18]MCZ0865862.1 nitric oxide reductase transcriptional regulator NorR [Dasania phycosphaerae]MCZ0869586.1 nitric oxide reductase transcriptional regulator NorR [Dasania phycosphaerae]
MTTSQFTQSLLAIVTDLSLALPEEERLQRLLRAFKQVFPCDASALLRLQGQTLIPLAVDGLSEDTLGRQFDLDQHPRLAHILLSRAPLRFDADSPLPDPYDGLIASEDTALHVHDCMGVSLHVHGKPWGVLTLDALKVGTFDHINTQELEAFIRLAEATVKTADLIHSLEAQLQHEHQVVQSVLADRSAQPMIGKSPAMASLRREITTVGESDLSVLICGETGVGKELVAQQIHQHSSRANAALVYVNCAALPENLIESELFGHEKGAFSGATQSRAGKFELANGGTLFLDEVGEIPIAAQAKLLRALQSGEIQRIGNDQALSVDVRIIAATNRQLPQEVSAGRFRADLYHRLSVYPIHVPPLRERKRDVLLLAGFFIEQQRRRLGLPAVRLDPHSQTQLLHYHWPGNIRELEHSISRAILKAKNNALATASLLQITADDLGIEQHSDQQSTAAATHISYSSAENIASTNTTTQPINIKLATDDFQRKLITKLLKQYQSNQAQVAQALGMDRSNFYRLKKRLEL